MSLLNTGSLVLFPLTTSHTAATILDVRALVLLLLEK